MKAAADLVGLSPRTFLDLIHNGVIEARNVSTGSVKARWLIDREAVRAFIARRTQSGTFVGGDGAERAERGPRSAFPGTLLVEVDPMTRDALRITLDARGRLSVEILKDGQDGVVVTCTKPDAAARLAKALLLNASKEN